MAAEKTLAFAVGRRPYRDTSLLITLFTERFGKIRAIVKGGRDVRYRYDSTFEPFSLNEVLVYRRRRGDLHLVTGASLVERYDALRTDLERLGTASYFIELMDALIDDADPHTGIFRLLADSLNFLSEGHSILRASRIFEMKLLAYLGFVPEISRCVRCHNEPGSSVYFSVKSGGILCEPCRMKREEYAFPVSLGALAFLEQCSTKDVRDLGRVKVTQEVGEQVEKMLRQFVDFHLEYKLRSLSFLEKIESRNRGASIAG